MTFQTLLIICLISTHFRSSESQQVAWGQLSSTHASLVVASEAEANKRFDDVMLTLMGSDLNDKRNIDFLFGKKLREYSNAISVMNSLDVQPAPSSTTSLQKLQLKLVSDQQSHNASEALAALYTKHPELMRQPEEVDVPMEGTEIMLNVLSQSQMKFKAIRQEASHIRRQSMADLLLADTIRKIVKLEEIYGTDAQLRSLMPLAVKQADLLNEIIDGLVNQDRYLP